ncbi:MAG TPA: hypothetical protein VFO18_17605 [Methylomirabilota bacterium]|nr:hypothetical protein [Methylomirabilota bacterium]
MLRRMFLGGLVIGVLGRLVGTSQAAVSVNIGINLPGPPRLVVVPGTPVLYAPSVHANYFFYSGQYYVFTNGVWYVGPRFNGPWVVVVPAYVPPPILRVPVTYYRVPPPEWRHHRHGGPPPWTAHYGRRWEGRGRDERRWEERERHEGRREERHEGRREEHREGRREGHERR